MSLKMKHKKSRSCRRRGHYNHHHHFINILILSIMWTLLFTQTTARPSLEALLPNKPSNDVAEQQQQDIFLNEMMTHTNREKLFNKMQKYHHHQPNYLSKWPGLRDLVSTLDYDDNSNNNLDESNEFLNTKFVERLLQLASSKGSEGYDNDIMRYDNGATNVIPSSSLSSNQRELPFKEHNIKKNVQYMSPCHFKICNMGRKRDARYINDY